MEEVDHLGVSPRAGWCLADLAFRSKNPTGENTMRAVVSALLAAGATVTLAMPARAATPFLTFSDTTTNIEDAANFPYIPGGRYLASLTSNVPVFPASLFITDFYETQGCTYFDGGGIEGCDEENFEYDLTLPPSGTDLSHFQTVLDVPALPGPFVLYYPDGDLLASNFSTPGNSLVDIFFQNGGTAVTTFTFTLSLVPEPCAWSLMMVGLGLAGAGLRRRTRLQTRSV
jgi:hypothetical protein